MCIRDSSHAGDARPLAGDSFYVESSTTVTQKLKGDDGQAVTRVQRQRSTRSNSNPQERVETQTVVNRAGQESDIPNFKGSYLGRFPLVSADFWTGDHLSERSRSVDAFPGTRARGTLTLKRT